MHDRCTLCCAQLRLLGALMRAVQGRASQGSVAFYALPLQESAARVLAAAGSPLLQRSATARAAGSLTVACVL